MPPSPPCGQSGCISSQIMLELNYIFCYHPQSRMLHLTKLGTSLQIQLKMQWWQNTLVHLLPII